MMLVRSLLCIVVFGAVTSIAWPQELSEPSPITLNQASDITQVSESMTYFIDKSANLNLLDVLQHYEAGSFSAVTKNRLSLGFYPKARVWVHFQIKNSTNTSQIRVLEAAGNLITATRVYQNPTNLVASDGRLRREGDVRRFDNIWSRHLYRLSIESQSSSEIFIAYQSNSSLRLHPMLYTEESWESKVAISGLLSGWYFGAMFMVLMLMAFRAIYYKSKVDWFYLSYVGALCVSIFFTRGLQKPLGFDLSGHQVDAAVFFAGIIALPSMVGFARTFISWPNHRKSKLDRALWLILGIYLIAAWSIWNISVGDGLKFLNVAALSLVVSLLIAGVWATLKGFANAKFFLLAFSPFLLVILWTTIEGLGLLVANDFGLDLFFITTFLHAILLSGAVVIRASSIKAAQDNLKKALYEAESNIAHQREWVQMLSHEIRTPISIISNHAQLAEKSLDASAPAQIHIKSISAGIRRLSANATQFLSIQKWSRSTAYTKELFDISELARKLVANTQHQTQEHILVFRSDLESRYVYADMNLIMIAVQNLLDNAIQYSPDGGSIEIVVNEHSPGVVELTIADEGVGISSEKLDCIFERYYRTNQVEGVIGSGLGLSLVKAIIEMHGGRVTCHSVLGEGTTFNIELPFRK